MPARRTEEVPLPMPIVRTDDVSLPELRVFSQLTDSELRRGLKLGHRYPNGLFVAESSLVARRALVSGIRPVSMLMEERWCAHEEPLVGEVLARDQSVPVYVMGHEAFCSLTGYQVTRGALTCFERPALRTPEELLEDARLVLVAEDVVNYTNMGALFRDAAALGADAMLVTPSCHDPLYRRALRVSMGCTFQVPWTRIGGDPDWAPALVPRLRQMGFSTVALALREDALAIDEVPGALSSSGCERVALVVGSEGPGLRQDTIDACDMSAIIPMSHGVDSLNVATAAAIALWELQAHATLGAGHLTRRAQGEAG